MLNTLIQTKIIMAGTGTDMKFPKGCPLRMLSNDRVLSKNEWLWNRWAPNDSKTRGTKRSVVESSTYL